MKAIFDTHPQPYKPTIVPANDPEFYAVRTSSFRHWWKELECADNRRRSPITVANVESGALKSVDEFAEEFVKFRGTISAFVGSDSSPEVREINSLGTIWTS